MVVIRLYWYIELYITERGSGDVNQEHEVRLIETASRKPVMEETPIKCEDIFKPLPGQDQPIRTIMTTGVAGIGKTILTHKFTLDWAEGKANQDIDFTFPFTFRELNLLKGKEFSLVGLLHHFFIETKEAGICRYDRFHFLWTSRTTRSGLMSQRRPRWTCCWQTSSGCCCSWWRSPDPHRQGSLWIPPGPTACHQDKRIVPACGNKSQAHRGWFYNRRRRHRPRFPVWLHHRPWKRR